MNVRWLKTVTKIVSKSKDTIIKYAPQIMAAAGATCFVAATYCAVKETPQAMEKLEEKKALDPDMSTLQKVAVVAPEYKKTICFTLAGVGFTAGAWKIEAARMAEITGALAAALKDNDRLVDAANAVVGEDKTKEIIEKKDEFTAEDCKVDHNGAIPSDQVVYPFLFPGGREIWMTWAQFKARHAYLVQTLATNRELSEYEYFSEMKLRCPTSDMQLNGWKVEPEEAGDILTADSALEWAYEKLGYSSEVIEYDSRTNMPGWRIYWDVQPKKL